MTLELATPLPPGAAAALGHILERIQHDGEGPYEGLLTGDGSPVELVFSTLDGRTRYTADVAGTGMPPWRRLSRANMLVSELGQSEGFPFRYLQSEPAALTWGAWLGGRHDDESDSYKIYAEVASVWSAAARVELRAALGRFATFLDSHAYQLRIVAATPGRPGCEVYFRASALLPRDLSRLLDVTGFYPRRDEVLSLMEDVSRRPARLRLPGSQHGFSLDIGPGGEIRTFSFFAFARSVFGSDNAARSTLLELAEARGWNLDAYAAASALLPPQTTGGPHHGLVSFVVPQDAPAGVSIGLRTPESWIPSDGRLG